MLKGPENVSDTTVVLVLTGPEMMPLALPTLGAVIHPLAHCLLAPRRFRAAAHCARIRKTV